MDGRQHRREAGALAPRAGRRPAHRAGGTDRRRSPRPCEAAPPAPRSRPNGAMRAISMRLDGRGRPHQVDRVPLMIDVETVRPRHRLTDLLGAVDQFESDLEAEILDRLPPDRLQQNFAPPQHAQNRAALRGRLAPLAARGLRLGAALLRRAASDRARRPRAVSTESTLSRARVRSMRSAQDDARARRAAPCASPFSNRASTAVVLVQRRRPAHAGRNVRRTAG